jgi:ParB family chromosome partitioning protein
MKWGYFLKMKISNIPVEKILVSDLNIRVDHLFGDPEDNELISNIESIGILQPIVVRPKEDKYEVLIGRRRFLSLSQTGSNEIPCIIKELDDEEALDASISENVFRKEIDPVTLGKWLKIRLEQGDISLSKYAKKIGKPKSTLSEWMRMNDLSQELQREVQTGTVPFNLGLQIARMNLSTEDERELVRIVQEVDLQEFKKALSRIKKSHEKRGAPKGLQIVRINFGLDSTAYEKLSSLADSSKKSLSDYCMSVLQDHLQE